MTDIARNFLGLIFLVGADIIVLAVFVALIIANYLACKSAFDYLGYDGLPLAKEAFLGEIVGPFFPDATLSHFYAFVLAVVIAIGLFLISNRLFHIWDLLKDRKRYLSQLDDDSAQIILWQIWDNIALLIVILPFLMASLTWDFQLFRYRSVFGALGIDDPAQAPLAVANWENQIEKYGHFFAWALAGIGAFGYIGVTGVAAVSLDFSFRRTTERFMILLSNVERLLSPIVQQEEQKPKGYVSKNHLADKFKTPPGLDLNENPTETEIGHGQETNDDRGDAASSQEHRHQEEIITQKDPTHTSSRTNSESPQSQGKAGMRAPQPEETKTAVTASGRSQDAQGSLFDDDEVFQHVGGRNNENTHLRDVIGKFGERVSMTAAMADNERYWVDPDSLEIWDRDYRRTLFPETF